MVREGWKGRGEEKGSGGRTGKKWRQIGGKGSRKKKER